MKNFKFTILMSLIDSKTLNQSLNSIIKQKLDFKENIQIILLNNNDNNFDLIYDYQKQYPQNIIILNNRENNYNTALKYAKGEYITFFNSNDFLPKNVLKEVYNHTDDNVNLLTIPRFMLETNGNDALNFRFKKNKHVNLIEEPEYIHVSLESSFIKTDLIKNYVFDDEQEIRFRSILRNIFKYINLETIENSPKVTRRNKKFLTYFKNDEFHGSIENDIIDNKEILIFKTKDYELNKITKNNLLLDFVQLKNRRLNFSGCFSSLCYNKCLSINLKVKLTSGKEEIIPVHYVEYNTSIRKAEKIWGIDWKQYYNFDLTYPINMDENYEFSFIITYNENGNKFTFEPKIVFGTNAMLSVYSHYYVKNSKIVLFSKNKIYIMPYSTKSMIKFELRSIFKILTSSTKLQFYYSIFIRILYFLYWPFLRNKRIWLFNDRPNFADDNSKHLFIYALKQDDGIEKFYSIMKDVPDYKKMKEISDNILPFKSIKHQIYYLYAEKIITTHVIDKFAHPLSHRNKKLYSGFNTSDKYFIQHGVTLGDISSRINKYKQNLSLFVNVSEIERNSIIKNPNYNYDENVIQILGFPRYDNLRNLGNKKQILLMPTWRSYIKDEKTLVESEFYKNMNSIFANEKLISFLKEKGYIIIFRPHPELLPYLHLFDIDNETIFVSKNESYQDLFNYSSILITDYSSVAFDFAYLKKPVLYYQYADEYNYDEGYFNFETMGFGEVISNENYLFDAIIKIINNKCEMTPRYLQRVENFFKYTDKNNCERVYKWIYNDK